MDKARKALLLVIAALGACAVTAQFYLNMTRHPEHTALWRAIDFASYFTNTTGILVTVAAILALVRPAAKLAQPGAVAAMAVYIFVVTVTYVLLLRGEAHGLYFFTNTSLHEVMPALVVLLWLVFTPKAGLRWSEPLGWAAYPAVYMAWILVRGAVIHHYPYFFADVDKLGYPRALLNGAGFLAAFYLLGLGTVALGRLAPLRKTATA
ncbi:MAG: Pr6Pr family membrane protein [Caulobacteraceae bacterium]